MNGSRPERWPPAFWALLIAAAMLRLGYVVLYPQIPLCGDCPAVTDSVLYDEVGRNVAAGRGFVGGFAARTYDLSAAIKPFEPEIGNGPAYPLFLALVDLVSGSRVAAIRVAQALVSTVLLWPLFAIARWTFDTRTAIGVTALATVYPAFIIYSGLVLTETLSATLLVAAMWAVFWARRGHGAGRWALAGVITGVEILLRPEVIPLAVVVAAVIVWRDRSRWTLSLVAIYLLAIGLTMSPWIVRNYRITHRLIPVSAHDGDTLWLGVKGWTEWHFDDPELRALVHGRSYLEQQDAFRAAAVREILAHPMAVVRTRLERFPDFWLSGHSAYVTGLTDRFVDYAARGAVWAWRAKASLLAFNTILIFAGLIGIAGALTRPGPAPAAVLLILAPIVCIAGVHLVMFAAPRYQVPMMPFLLIFAASFVSGSRPVGAE